MGKLHAAQLQIYGNFWCRWVNWQVCDGGAVVMCGGGR